MADPRPDVLQLYSYPTSNGVKVSITLEELGLPYEVHSIDVTRNETWTPQFLTLNPNVIPTCNRFVGRIIA
jgi:GST-like protein